MRFGVGCDEIQMMEAWKDEWELAKQRPPPATPTEEVARQGWQPQFSGIGRSP